jgi:hypothetical protein
MYKSQVSRCLLQRLDNNIGITGYVVVAITYVDVGKRCDLVLILVKKSQLTSGDNTEYLSSINVTHDSSIIPVNWRANVVWQYKYIYI